MCCTALYDFVITALRQGDSESRNVPLTGGAIEITDTCRASYRKRLRAICRTFSVSECRSRQPVKNSEDYNTKTYSLT